MRKTTWTITLLIGTALAVFAAERPARWAQPVNRPGLPNLHKVSDTLYRSAQPTPEGMTNLVAMGIKTVINLRKFHSDTDEIGKLNLTPHRIPINTWDLEFDQAKTFLTLVADTNNAPVLVHCLHGADRTGAMIALYRVAREGWTVEEALEEMTRGGYGYHAVWRNLPTFIRDTAARLRPPPPPPPPTLKSLPPDSN